MNRKEVLNILETLTDGDFQKLIFFLDVPNSSIPAPTKTKIERAIDLLRWCESPTGCGLEKVEHELREMGAIETVNQSQKSDRQDNEIETKTHQSFTEILPNNVELEMIAIPAGSFIMGSHESEFEQPIHRVTLQQFHLSKYPVTQAQYQAIMGKNPSEFKEDSRPVEMVTWYEAMEFCQILSQLTGKNYQLPSEAQWEYACRAGNTGKWCFGNEEYKLQDYAWYDANSNQQTHPVGQKKPNDWGLYDMHGNVWEWCADDWHYSYKGAPTDGSAWLDNDNSSESMKYAVIRGGSWLDFPDVCCSAIRVIYIRRDIRYVDNGFRIICEMK